MSTTLEMGARLSGGNGSALGTALIPEARPRMETTSRYQDLADSGRGTGGAKLADFLGFFSLGLGLVEVAAPHLIARAVGIHAPDDVHRTTIRAMGVREISHGVAILSNQQPAKSVWSRVIGDGLDLALLGKTLANPRNDRGLTMFAIANVLAVSALDVMCARQLSMQPRTAATSGGGGVVRTKHSVTVGRPVEEVFAFWRNFENLPRFMRHLRTVRVLDDRRSHWIARAPAGKNVEWDAEIVEEQPNELIAWRSLAGADVHNAGVVRFQPAPGGRGTEVRVELEYHPPFGKLGSKVAKLFREEPGQQVRDDLHHFKQVMETGEILFSDASKQPGPHPAQPDEKPARL